VIGYYIGQGIVTMSPFSSLQLI